MYQASKKWFSLHAFEDTIVSRSRPTKHNQQIIQNNMIDVAACCLVLSSLSGTIWKVVIPCALEVFMFKEMKPRNSSASVVDGLDGLIKNEE